MEERYEKNCKCPRCHTYRIIEKTEKIYSDAGIKRPDVDTDDPLRALEIYVSDLEKRLAPRLKQMKARKQ